MEDFGDVLKQMLHGVRGELEATANQRVCQELAIWSGTRIGELEGDTLYGFQHEARPGQLRDAVGDLVVDGREVRATSVETTGSNVTLAVSEDLGATIPEAMLRMQDSRLLHWLKERIQGELLRGVQEESLAHRLAVGASSSRLQPEPAPARRSRPDELNQEQLRAVDAALHCDITRLWGPPGCGKTQTVARVVEAWVDRGRSVLLAGPTNASVDGLLERFLSLGAWDSLLQEGRVIRFGPIESPSLKERFGDRVSFSAIVERKAAPLRGKELELRQELETLAQSGRDDPPWHEVNELKARLRSVETRLRLLPRSVLDEAVVVATTVHRAGLGQLSREFDAVAFDEASMINVAWGVLTAMIARERILVAGDPRQLGPIALSRAPESIRWLHRSVIECMDMDQECDLDRTGCVMLREQYRMHETICHTVGEISYAGRLRTAPELSRSGLGPGLPGPLLYINTVKWGCECRRVGRGFSRENPRQADVIIRALRALLHDCGPIATALITPYRAQSARLGRLVREANLAHVEVGTVHRFQSREAPIVLLDLPDGPGLKVGRFLRARDSHEDGARLLTVGISRAQSHLIVVGNLPWIARRIPRDGPFMTLLEHLATRGLEMPVPPELIRSPELRSTHLHRHRRQSGLVTPRSPHQ